MDRNHLLIGWCVSFFDGIIRIDVAAAAYENIYKRERKTSFIRLYRCCIVLRWHEPEAAVKSHVRESWASIYLTSSLRLWRNITESVSKSLVITSTHRSNDGLIHTYSIWINSKFPINQCAIMPPSIICVGQPMLYRIRNCFMGIGFVVLYKRDVSKTAALYVLPGNATILVCPINPRGLYNISF